MVYPSHPFFKPHRHSTEHYRSLTSLVLHRHATNRPTLPKFVTLTRPHYHTTAPTPPQHFVPLTISPPLDAFIASILELETPHFVPNVRTLLNLHRPPQLASTQTPLCTLLHPVPVLREPTTPYTPLGSLATPLPLLMPTLLNEHRLPAVPRTNRLILQQVPINSHRAPETLVARTHPLYTLLVKPLDTTPPTRLPPLLATLLPTATALDILTLTPYDALGSLTFPLPVTSLTLVQKLPPTQPDPLVSLQLDKPVNTPIHVTLDISNRLFPPTPPNNLLISLAFEHPLLLGNVLNRTRRNPLTLSRHAPLHPRPTVPPLLEPLVPVTLRERRIPSSEALSPPALATPTSQEFLLELDATPEPLISTIQLDAM